MTGATPHHNYTSTACGHAQLEGDHDLHASCRRSCKFCDAPCDCWCHTQGAHTDAQPSWVDQARDIALRAIADAEDRLHPDLAEQIRTDPRLFWARGEVQPPGERQPNPQEDR